MNALSEGLWRYTQEEYERLEGVLSVEEIGQLEADVESGWQFLKQVIEPCISSDDKETKYLVEEKIQEGLRWNIFEPVAVAYFVICDDERCYSGTSHSFEINTLLHVYFGQGWDTYASARAYVQDFLDGYEFDRKQLMFSIYVVYLFDCAERSKE